MKQVLVCQHVNCLAQGSADVIAALVAQDIPSMAIIASECQGQCNLGPTVRVLPDEIWYCRVKVADVAAISHTHLQNGHPVTALLHPRFHPQF